MTSRLLGVLALTVTIAACDRRSTTTGPCPSGAEATSRAGVALFETYGEMLAAVLGAVTETADCEATRQALVALAPAATEFLARSEELAPAMRALTPACKADLERRLGTRADALEATYAPRIEHGMKLLPRVCGAHPGMREAFEAAIVGLKKKRA